MAGGQKKLEAEIRIKGKADGSLNQLAAALQGIATIAQGISKPIQEVIEDSLEYYKGYEKNMLDAKGALSAQYDSYAELERVMSNLDTQAQNWAASTIFHTSDVSKAISEAAHAGWSYEEMTSGIPAAMQLAQAGGYELSSALDQVIKVTNASGTAFEDVGEMIDMWALASNLGATNVEQMGEALTRMGSTVQFAGGMDQAFTMLTLLANMGTVGEEAGTLLRNSMLRLVAPTKKAGEAMAALEITDDEADELAADADALAAANKQLEKYGFSVYNEKGELKDMTTIFSDLSNAVDGMTDQDRNTLLSAIFPTRTITGAMNLLKSIENGSWTEVLSQMSEAKGYAAEVAGIQNESYANQIELFTSKVEKLKTTIGSIVAPNLEKVMTAVGGVLDKINGLDATTTAGLTGMLEGIAAVGPLTSGVAVIASLFASMNKYQLAIAGTALALTGVAAAIGAISEVSSQNWKDNFGDMALDLKTLNDNVKSIQTPFTEGLSSISGAYSALTTALTEYETGVSAFMSGIDTSTITGKALTPVEIQSLKDYGASIGSAVLEGINGASTISLSTLNLAYGDENGEVSEENSAVYNSLYDKIDSFYGGLSEHATDIGTQLGSALSSALEDRVIDIDEQAMIQKLVDEYNTIQEQVAAVLAQQNLYEQIEAASRVSWDTFSEFSSGLMTTYDERVAGVNAAFDGLQAVSRMAIENDLKRQLTDEEWRERDEYKNNEAQRAEQIAAVGDEFARPLNTALETLMRSSDASDAWNMLNTMASAGYTPDQFDGNYGLWSQFTDVPVSQLIEQFKIVGGALADIQKRSPDLYTAMGGDAINGWVDAMYGKGLTYMSAVGDSGGTESEFAAGYAGGKKITVPVTADTSKAEGQIDQLNGESVSVNVNANISGIGAKIKSLTSRTYATGGRATEASIFGEAGAEWAIPEQHSERTADLLDSARKASGFTWGELIARTGGLNSRSVPSGSTFVYSPTINTNDSNGVADALARDKEMMKRWWRKMQQQDSMEVYA